MMKRDENNLASSTLLTSSDVRDSFGIIVSYAVKVKLYLGALGGELTAELPFILMRPKPSDRVKLVSTDSVLIEDIPHEKVDEKVKF